MAQLRPGPPAPLACARARYAKRTEFLDGTVPGPVPSRFRDTSRVSTGVSGMVTPGEKSRSPRVRWQSRQASPG